MRVFVIWDLTSPAVHTLLEALPELCPEHAGQPITWHIPSASGPAQKLGRDVIARGIRDSDHVIALLDRPSASIGWQVGLALGWQRSMQLAFLGSALPTWTQSGVLKGLFAHHLNDVTGIPELLGQQHWEMPALATAGATPGYLLLCPSGPVGSTLRAVAQQDPRAHTLPEDGWGLYELPAQLAGCERVVWILASELRDGAEHAASGVVAGFAEASGLPVAVLRADDVPPVVEVQPRELRFHGLAEFKQKLLTATTAGRLSPLARASALPVPGRSGTPESEPVGRAPGPRRARTVLLLILLGLGALGLGGVAINRWLRRPGPPAASPSAAASPPVSPPVTVKVAAVPPIAPPAPHSGSHRSGVGHRTQRGQSEVLPPPLDPRRPMDPVVPTPERATLPPPDLATPPPKLAPPPKPAPERASGPPMDDEHFQALLTTLRRTISGESQRNFLKDQISDGKWFRCGQIAQAMRVPVSSEQKIQIAVILYSRVIDPENTAELLAALWHESDRERLRALLHRSP